MIYFQSQRLVLNNYSHSGSLCLWFTYLAYTFFARHGFVAKEFLEPGCLGQPVSDYEVGCQKPPFPYKRGNDTQYIDHYPYECSTFLPGLVLSLICRLKAQEGTKGKPPVVAGGCSLYLKTRASLACKSPILWGCLICCRRLLHIRASNVLLPSGWKPWVLRLQWLVDWVTGVTGSKLPNIWWLPKLKPQAQGNSSCTTRISAMRLLRLLPWKGAKLWFVWEVWLMACWVWGTFQLWPKLWGAWAGELFSRFCRAVTAVGVLEAFKMMLKDWISSYPFWKAIAGFRKLCCWVRPLVARMRFIIWKQGPKKAWSQALFCKRPWVIAKRSWWNSAVMRNWNFCKSLRSWLPKWLPKEKDRTCFPEAPVSFLGLQMSSLPTALIRWLGGWQMMTCSLLI